MAETNSKRLEWIVIWLIAIEIWMGIAENPIFKGKRILCSVLLPSIILIFKKLDNVGIDNVKNWLIKRK